MIVYDVHHQNMRAEPCPTFSTGHGEGHHSDHSSTARSHDGTQEDHHTTSSNGYTKEEDDTQIGHNVLVIPKNEIYKRRHLFPAEKYHRTIVVWSTDPTSLSTVIDTFNSTALICPQKVDGGVFHLQTRYGTQRQVPILIAEHMM